MANESTAADLLGLAELAELGGVSRRTVRFYVQEDLLPPPRGVGRGRHYGPEHVTRLVEVKALQEQGRSLSEIREVLAGGRKARAAVPPPTPRTHWVRLEVMPGVELNVSSAHRVPSPGRLAELAEWCRLHLRWPEEEDR